MRLPLSVMLICRSVAAVGFGSAFGFTSSAGAVGVTVRNVGQSSASASANVPAATVDDRGDCESPRTIQEANGGPALCPAGTWPAPGGDWGPAVRVASNDDLEIDFGAPRTSVHAVLTSNYAAGLTTPGGGPVKNVDLGYVTGEPVGDGTVWRFTLPGLDLRARTLNFAVLAVTATGPIGEPVNLGLSVRTPRFVSGTAIGCGDAYFGPGDVRFYCDPESSTAPPPVGGPDVQPGSPPSSGATVLPVEAEPAISLVGDPVIRGTTLRTRITVAGPGVADLAVRARHGRWKSLKRARIKRSGSHLITRSLPVGRDGRRMRVEQVRLRWSPKTGADQTLKALPKKQSEPK